MNNNSETRLQNCFTTLSLYLNVEVSWILQWQEVVHHQTEEKYFLLKSVFSSKYRNM